MTWWKKDTVHKKLRPITYCRNSAEVGRENSSEIQEETSQTFAEKSGLNKELRPEFQELVKRVVEDNSIIFVPVIDVSQWEQFQDTKRRRTKS